MKNLLFALFISLAFVACKNEKETEATVTEEISVEETTTETPQSYVWWKGDKVLGAGSHNGKILFSETNFDVKDGMVTGGEFTVDMTTISSDDLEGKKAENLIGHLSNEDFFDVPQYPTANFKILEINKDDSLGEDTYNVTGMMTIKDVTKNMTIPAKMKVKGDAVKFQSDFTIDRSEFNVNHNSPTKVLDVAKDAAIKDEVEMKVVISK